MKRITLLTLIISNGIFLLGQERVNKALPVIHQEVLSSLNNATGWIKGADDIWISRKNRIPVYDLSSSILIDYEENKPGTDNFTSLEFRNVKYKDKDLIVLIVNGMTGAYMYPAIKEDWFDIPTSVGYFMEPLELMKLDSMVDGVINIVELEYIDIGSGGNGRSYQEKLNNIEKGFEEVGETYNKIVFHVWPLKEKGIVQFNMYLARPDEYSDIFNWSISGPHKQYALDPKADGLIDRFKIRYGVQAEEIYMTDKLFDWLYYEVSYDEFMNFLSRGK